MSAYRDIRCLPVAPSLIDVLMRNGFTSSEDLLGMTPTSLLQEIKRTPDPAKLEVSLEDCLEVLRVAFQSDQTSNLTSTNISAKDLFSLASSEKSIITFCKQIDQMLGGGIPLGQITEIYGAPGTGKTQFAIQLAVDAQIPECFNGVGGKTLYIDTEGSFTAVRAADMAGALSSHLNRVMASQVKMKNSSISIEEAQKFSDSFRRDNLLSSIHLYRPHDIVELMAIIQQLPSLLQDMNDIKLVIIDSIAFFFRQNSRDIPARNRQLSQLVQQLNQCAFDYRIAIVVTNHVTTRLEHEELSNSLGNTLTSSSTSSNTSNTATANTANTSSSTSSSTSVRLVPALGEHWSHCITNRIRLQWNNPSEDSDTLRSISNISSMDSPMRQAVLEKSPLLPTSSASFKICSAGLRDVIMNPVSTTSAASTSWSSNNNQSSYHDRQVRLDKIR